MIVVPQPMPDEIERSILGRTIRLNGLGARQSADAIKNVRRVAGIDTSRVGSTVGLIAFLVQRDPRDFVRHHTLFPWWIVLRLGKWLDAEGRLRDRSLAQTIQPHRPFVSLCPDCVLEDLQFHGLSYWRRSHQLSGAYECLKHGAGLRHYVDVDIVQTLPSEALDREPYRVSSLLRDSEPAPGHGAQCGPPGAPHQAKSVREKWLDCAVTGLSAGLLPPSPLSCRRRD